MTLGAVAGSRQRSGAPVTPAEIITNGGFASSASWNGVGTGGMTVSSGKANYASTPAFNGIYQTGLTPTAGKYYEMTFTISNYTAGSLRGQMLNGTSAPVGAIRNANGTYTERLLMGTGNTWFQLQATAAGTTLSVDDVSVIGPYNTSTVGGA